MISLPFKDIFEKFEKTYSSIEVRNVIIKKDGQDLTVLSILHCRDVDVRELTQEYQQMEEDLGKIETENLKITYESYAIAQLNEVLEAFSLKKQLLMEQLSCQIQDHSPYINVEDFNHFEGIVASNIEPTFHQELQNYDVEVLKSGYSSSHTAIKTMLNLREYGPGNALSFLVILPINAKFLRGDRKDRSISLSVRYHKNFENLQINARLIRGERKDIIKTKIISVNKKSDEEIDSNYFRDDYQIQFSSMIEKDLVELELLSLSKPQLILDTFPINWEGVVKKTRILTINAKIRVACLSDEDKTKTMNKIRNIKIGKLTEDEKCDLIAQFFYLLGLEVFPVEILKSYDRFKKFENMPHVDVIAYYPLTNTIFLIEEVRKFGSEHFHKTRKLIIESLKDYIDLKNEFIEHFVVIGKISKDLELPEGFKPINIPHNEFERYYSQILQLDPVDSNFSNLLEEIYKKLNLLNS